MKTAMTDFSVSKGKPDDTALSLVRPALHSARSRRTASTVLLAEMPPGAGTGTQGLGDA
jgi:hypothetical protein